MDRTDQDLAEGVLRRLPWLGEGREALVGQMLAHGRVVRLAPGQWAYAEGDDEAGVMVVLSGSVELLCRAAGDREVLIGYAGPGGAIGQTTRFGGGPRLLTVICRDDCALLQVSDRALARIAAEAPAIWEAVAALLYLQLRQLLHLVADATALPPRERLAGRLELLSRTAGGGELVLNQESLGEMTGLSRKTVNGYLKQFEAAGLVRRAYGRIQVLDPRGLRRIAEATPS